MRGRGGEGHIGPRGGGRRASPTKTTPRAHSTFQTTGRTIETREKTDYVQKSIASDIGQLPQSELAALPRSVDRIRIGRCAMLCAPAVGSGKSGTLRFFVGRQKKRGEIQSTQFKQTAKNYKNNVHTHLGIATFPYFLHTNSHQNIKVGHRWCTRVTKTMLYADCDSLNHRHQRS